MGLASRKLAVLGDIAIHEKVPADFWNEIVSAMTSRFKEEDVVGGLEVGILALGKQLSTYFPHGTNDVDELANTLRTND